jgi:DNA primase
MTVEEMESFLKGIGIETYGARGSEVKALCPGHVERTGKPDRNPSWSINSDTGAHNCFSCGFRGGLQYLISYVNGVPIEEAEEWVRNNTSDLSRRLEQALRPPVVVEDSTNPLTEANLSAYTDPPVDLLKSRGLTAEAAKQFGLLYDARRECWIIPIRDRNEKLLGWQEKGSRSRYFNNYPKGVQKSHSLFGYGQYKGGTMVVVESPLDVVRLASVGVEGGVATYGTSVSKEQLNLIKGADKVVVAMDNDEAGRRASEDIWRKSIDMWFECWFFDYSGIDWVERDSVKDVGAMSKAEILQGLNNAKHALYGERVFK